MDPEPERCQFFIPRKSRSCRMLVKKGYKYCGEHAGEERKRIRCPLDPNHTVNEDDLQEHLTRCNSRLNTDLPYVRRDVNGISSAEPASDHDSTAFSLTQLSETELDEIIKKIESIYAGWDVPVENAFLEHGSMKAVVESDVYGSNSKRHLKQQSSILEHADRLGVLDKGQRESICYVEFGAGRAKLSYWLAKAVEEKLTQGEKNLESGRVTYLLIERSGQRYKFENKIAQSEATPSGDDHKPKTSEFHRIRCAIEHVDLRLVECVRDSNSCVAFCKHLCGSGTDAALRCLVNAASPNDSSAKIIAALLAPCCHHRCDWRSFTGRDILIDLGLAEFEFKALTSMCSWATCGLVTADDDKTKIDRKTIGKKCKLLLDYARCKFLEKSGLFSVKLCFYVPENVTPENVLLIVTLKNI